MNGRRRYRRRIRHKHLRGLATGSMLGFAPVFFMVFIGLWWDTHCTGYFTSEEFYESRFTEFSHKASVWVEDYRRQHGCLPDSLQIEGLERSRWEENLYYNSFEYICTEFYYIRRPNETYAFAEPGGWRWYVSTPDSSWFEFRRWDFKGDSSVVVVVPDRGCT